LTVASIPSKEKPQSLLALRLAVVLGYGFVGSLVLLIFLTMGLDSSTQRGVLALYICGAFLGALGLGWSLDRLVARPVQVLVQQVRSATVEGWPERLVVPVWRGEITELGLALEELRSRMVEKQEALNDLNQELEQRILERTRELEETQVQLIEAAKLAGLGQLATGVAHEVNNPTGIILTRTGFLLSVAKEEGLDAEVVEDLKVIESQARRVSTITRGLLDFGRRADGERMEVDLNEVIREAVGLLEYRAGEREVGLEVTCEDEPVLVWANKDQIAQVAFNLLSNALDASSSGGRVHLYSSQGGFTVEDAGHGISEPDRVRLFEPFFTTKAPGEGTGLGLSVSWRIVTDHGGTIVVETKEGVGTKMRVLLPQNARPQ
ncbi:MAG: ATP-binding protein, partial [Cyanobacteriota bacterium]|nr:ATP-binding protein [Cyanobacteriota bacterium]